MWTLLTSLAPAMLQVIRQGVFVAKVTVRDEYGLGAGASYGSAVSAAYLFGRPTAGATARPYLALSLGLFGDVGLGVTALEAVETTGISLIARGTGRLGLRLGASIGQAARVTSPWPAPNRIAPAAEHVAGDDHALDPARSPGSRQLPVEPSS